MTTLNETTMFVSDTNPLLMDHADERRRAVAGQATEQVPPQRRAVARDPRYQVDSAGNVYGLKGQKLRPVVAGPGRTPYVVLRGKRHYICDLIAEAFVPNPSGLRHVLCRDNNVLNNSASNLRWASEAEALRNKYGLCGELHPRTKLTDSQALQLTQDYKSGVQVKRLAEIYNVRIGVIYSILQRTGTPRRGKRGKLTDRQVAQIARDRASGKTIAELAEAHKVVPQTIRNALKRPPQQALTVYRAIIPARRGREGCPQ